MHRTGAGLLAPFGGLYAGSSAAVRVASFAVREHGRIPAPTINR